ncbi:hypothetical protein U9M48_041588 [Paspalum notatum var. saurae]|uniref:Inositol polyphosphate-related phosphatase domain-containing protein n=1 Tax=Paspalum notatum var. saurae TaxID=547442 RepID=A0AAQ3UPD4_PASNO
MRRTGNPTMSKVDERSCVGQQRRRKSCSDRDASLLARTHLSRGGWLAERESSDSEPAAAASSSSSPVWLPGAGLVVAASQGPQVINREFDHACHSFQEIVPLNAGNVLGAEDKGPARKWLDLIRRALNPPCSASAAGPAGSGSSRGRRSPSGRVSFSGLLAAADDDDSCRPSTASSEPDDDDLSTTTPSSSSEEEPEAASGGGGGGGGGYRLAASKQMVGVLLCVWVRADAAPRVAAVAASRMGTGVLGYMGNKGAVSVSLALRGAPALCFVCTHLASGDRPGDEARRNADAAEILRRTRFSSGIWRGRPPPETIMEHDKVIWLGDLNYRLVVAASSNGGCGVRELVERGEWEALLERDQLRAERSAGRVFAGAGWEEGRIRFPPTYKYVAESDAYAIDDDDGCSTSSFTSGSGGSRPREKTTKKKKRTPAWCDRILWRGEGMEQHWYARGESRFSDHRPVSALFSISARLHDADEETLLVARCRRRTCCPPPPHSSRF